MNDFVTQLFAPVLSATLPIPDGWPLAYIEVVSILLGIGLAGWSLKVRTVKYSLYVVIPIGFVAILAMIYLVNYRIIDYVRDDTVVAIPIIPNPEMKEYYPPDGKFFDETVPSEARRKIEGEPTSIGSVITKVLYLQVVFLLALIRAYLVSVALVEAFRHPLVKRILKRWS